MTIQSSQETEGVVGTVAKACSSCCGTKGNVKTEKAKNSQLVRVMPRSAQRDGSETGEEEYSRVQVHDSQQHNQVVLKEAEQEVQRIRKASELARRKTIDRVRQQEEKADARVQKRLALRKKAKQMGALQKCAVFAKISEASRNHIVDGMMYEKIAGGAVLCMQADPADSMYLLMSGACTVTINMKEVATLSPLDVFGESALFSSNENAEDPSRFRTATVVAVNDLEVLVLQKQQLNRLLASGDLDESTVAALSQVAQERKRANFGFLNNSVV